MVWCGGFGILITFSLLSLSTLYIYFPFFFLLMFLPNVLIGLMYVYVCILGTFEANSGIQFWIYDSSCLFVVRIFRRWQVVELEMRFYTGNTLCTYPSNLTCYFFLVEMYYNLFIMNKGYINRTWRHVWFILFVLAEFKVLYFIVSCHESAGEIMGSK